MIFDGCVRTLRLIGGGSLKRGKYPAEVRTQIWRTRLIAWIVQVLRGVIPLRSFVIHLDPQAQMNINQHSRMTEAGFILVVTVVSGVSNTLLLTLTL